MRKLQLNTEELRVESFATLDADAANRGTVHGQDGTLSGGGGCLGSRDVSVCVCDTTHTQRFPECDPSAETFCVGDTVCDA